MVQATTAATSGPILTQLSNPLILAPLAILGTIVVLAYAYTRLDFSDDEVFENESLEDMIKPQFTEIMSKFGKKTDKSFHRDLKKLGDAYKVVRYTEANDYNGESRINKVSAKNVADDTSLDDLVKAGVINTAQKEKMEDNKEVPHRLVQTRPNDSLLKVLWLFTDKLLGMEKFTDYYFTPEILLVDSPSEDAISIKRNAQFRPFAGMYVPMYESTFGILRSVTMRSMYEQALEDQANYHEKVNYFDAKFSMKRQYTFAEAEAERKKWDSGAASDAEAD